MNPLDLDYESIDGEELIAQSALPGQDACCR